jgi:hypothetical protein
MPMSDYTALAGPLLCLGRFVNGMTRELVGLGSSAILAVQAIHASTMHDAKSAVAIPAKKRTMAVVSVTSFVLNWYRLARKTTSASAQIVIATQRDLPLCSEVR